MKVLSSTKLIFLVCLLEMVSLGHSALVSNISKLLLIPLLNLSVFPASGSTQKLKDHIKAPLTNEEILGHLSSVTSASATLEDFRKGLEALDHSKQKATVPKPNSRKKRTLPDSSKAILLGDIERWLDPVTSASATKDEIMGSLRAAFKSGIVLRRKRYTPQPYVQSENEIPEDGIPGFGSIINDIKPYLHDIANSADSKNTLNNMLTKVFTPSTEMKSEVPYDTGTSLFSRIYGALKRFVARIKQMLKDFFVARLEKMFSLLGEVERNASVDTDEATIGTIPDKLFEQGTSLFSKFYGALKEFVARIKQILSEFSMSLLQKSLSLVEAVERNASFDIDDTTKGYVSATDDGELASNVNHLLRNIKSNLSLDINMISKHKRSIADMFGGAYNFTVRRAFTGVAAGGHALRSLFGGGEPSRSGFDFFDR